MATAVRLLWILPLMALLLFAHPARTQGGEYITVSGSGPSLTAVFTSSPPAIDGTLSPGEWSSPRAISLNGFNDPSKTRTGELYLLNTSTDLFVALVFAETVSSSRDIAEINIDSPHDHVATAGKEDALRYDGGTVDKFWMGSDWSQDQIQHGMVARSHTDGKYVYEFRKPLNSGDAQDMAVSPGATIGFRFHIGDDDISEGFRYPPDSRSGGDTSVEWPKWSDLVLAISASSTTAPTLTDPSAGSQLATMNTTLRWANPSSTTQVHVRVTPANNDGPGVNLILGAATSLRIPPPPEWYGLLPGMSYAWKVRSSTAATALDENSALWGPWSEERTFRTPSRDSTRLTAVAPADGGTVPAQPQTLRWNNGDQDVFYYELQVSPDRNFGEAGPVASVWQNLVHCCVTASPNSWTTPDLQPATTYFWRLRPRIQGDGTPVAWGSTWSFRVQ